MPYSNDYVKRMIEMFGEFILALTVRLEEADTADEALDVRADIDKTYREALNMDSEFVMSAPVDYLVLSTSLGRLGDTNKLLALADLLDVDALARDKTGDLDGSLERRVKAVNILAEYALRTEHHPEADVMTRVDAQMDALGDAPLPFDALRRLFRLYDRANRFASAEDALYEGLEQAPDDESEESLAGLGEQFYQRLLKLDDHTLEAGDLPRDEVLAGLKELQGD